MPKVAEIQDILDQIAVSAATPEQALLIADLGKKLAQQLHEAHLERGALAQTIQDIITQVEEMRTASAQHRVELAQIVNDKLEKVSDRLHTFANFLQGVENKVHDLVDMQQLILDALQGAGYDRPANTDEQ